MSEHHELQAAPGVLTGEAVIKDKDGNIKGRFTFSTPATPEQAKAIQEGLNHGSNTPRNNS